MDREARRVAERIAQSQPQTKEEIYENLNLIEQLVTILDPRDDFDAALLEAINSLQQSLEQLSGSGEIEGEVSRLVSLLEQQVRGRVKTTDLPIGMAGRAAEPIPNDGTGMVVFQINGSNYAVTVEADEAVSKRDAVVVNGRENLVTPVSDVGDVLGDDLIGTGDDFEVTETTGGAGNDGNVVIEPGGTKTVVTGTIADSGFWFLTGTNDEQYATYQYYIGDDPILDQPLKEPLGLYNDPFRFPRPVNVNGDISVEVHLNSGAQSPTEFYSKVGYLR